MAFDLFESIGSAIPWGLLDKASAMLGESPQATKLGFSTGIASIVGGLRAKAQTPQGATQIFSSLQQNGYLAPGGFDAERTFGRAGSGLGQALEKGQGLLGSLFGGATSGMADEVSRATDIKSTSASKLLALGAPLVMGVLGRHVGTSGVSGLRTILLGGQPLPAPKVTTKRELIRPEYQRTRWGRLVIPAAIILALFALGNWMRHRPGHVQQKVSEVMKAQPKQEAQQAQPAPKEQPSAQAEQPAVPQEQPSAQAEQPAVPEEQPSAQAEQPAAPEQPPMAEEPSTGGGGIAGAAVATKPMMLDESARGLNEVMSSEKALPQTFVLKGVEFPPGASNLNTTAKASLDNVAGILKEYPDAKITVEGHADSTGNATSNDRLSEARAKAVTNGLMDRGVKADQLMTQAMSSQDPLVSDASAGGRSMNRLARVTVVER